MIGKTIRRLRKERGFSQEELAEKLNISAQAVSKWENGRGVPDVFLLAQLARELCVSADVLLGVTEDKDAYLLNILDEIYRTKNVGEAYDAVQAALQRYPNAPILLMNSLELGISLAYPESDCYDEGRAKDVYGACERQTRLLETYSKSPDDILRANMIMTLLHAAFGEFEKARSRAEKFPVRADMTYNTMRAYIAHAKGDSGEEERFCAEDIRLHGASLTKLLTLRALALESAERYGDALDSLRAVFSLIELLYPDEGNSFKFQLLFNERGCIYDILARVCREAGRDGEAEEWHEKKKAFDEWYDGLKKEI